MFKVFPKFSSITIQDKEEYERFIKQFPPFSDLSFATLMIWWNFDKSLKVAHLNNNLVISYYSPGDEQNSGLSLIGTNKVDESIRTILKYLEHKGEAARLVHLPEFVINNIKDPTTLSVKGERDYDEYIIPIDRLYPMEGLNSLKRWKIRKFLEAVGDDSIEIRSLDLSCKENRALLCRAMKRWQAQGIKSENDANGMERKAIRRSVRYSKELGINNICLYVRGRLVGFALFQIGHDGRYIIANHIRANYEFPRSFDYVTYICAQWAATHNIPYLNMEMDLGIPGLRNHKIGLKPADFFRKYELSSLS